MGRVGALHQGREHFWTWERVDRLREGASELCLLEESSRALPGRVSPGIGIPLQENSPGVLATTLETLIAHLEARERVGRRLYVERFILELHLQRMELFLYYVATS